MRLERAYAFLCWVVSCMSVSLRKSSSQASAAALDLKIELLRSLTILFAVDQHITDETSAHYENAFMRVQDHLDEPTRFFIAQSLAAVPHTPSSIIDALTLGQDEATHYTLEHAIHVPPSRLMAAAAWQAASLAQCVARRADIDSEIIRILAERPEQKIVITLMENPHIEFDHATQHHVQRRARSNPDLMRALAQRTQDATLMHSVFLQANGDMRRRIMLDVRRKYLAQPMADAQSDEAMVSKIASLTIMANVCEVISALVMESLLCKADEAAKIVNDADGEPLALWAAWIGCPADVMAPLITHLMEDHPRKASHVAYLLDIISHVPFAVADDILRAALASPIPQRLSPASVPALAQAPERKSQKWHIAARPSSTSALETKSAPSVKVQSATSKK